MRSSSRFLVTLAGVCLLATTAYAARPTSPGGGPPACDPDAVAAATAAIADACPCEGQTDEAGNVVPWKNHGQYVRCVAHATRDAVKASDGTLTRRCLKESVRCAARSTCGRPEGFVTCTIDLSCSFRPSAEACTAAGGVAGSGSCCAPAPGSPSGAFVDGASFY
jgi:hypothetical protein